MGENSKLGKRATAPNNNGAHPHVDESVPNVARIYDYLLGGQDNYACDREVAKRLLKLIPDALTACYHNRQFLQNAARFLVGEAGISQFIDIGAGLPTRGNVHEIVQAVNPDARVLYVDNDPVVVVHAQALLVGNPTAIAINRDLRCPEQILGHPALQALINLEQPVALFLVAILHFIDDKDDPHGIVNRLKAALPSGSYIVLSHVTSDDVSADVSRRVGRLYERTNAPGIPRRRAEISQFFDGLELLEPGLVNVCAWRSDTSSSEETRTIFYAGVARKPTTELRGVGRKP